MPMNLNDAEYLADTISQKIGQLLNERNILRRELERSINSNIGREKDFVRTYQENIVNSAINSEVTARLEHMLLIK